MFKGDPKLQDPKLLENHCDPHNTNVYASIQVVLHDIHSYKNRELSNQFALVLSNLNISAPPKLDKVLQNFQTAQIKKLFLILANIAEEIKKGGRAGALDRILGAQRMSGEKDAFCLLVGQKKDYVDTGNGIHERGIWFDLGYEKRIGFNQVGNNISIISLGRGHR